MTKILYIGGTGRVGSTVLDQLLGSCEGWLSGGELTFIWDKGLGQGGRCSCGQMVADCPVWGAALTEIGASPDTAARMAALRRRCQSTHLPLVPIRPLAERRLDALEEFPDVVEALYRTVLTQTGNRVLIDSSKEPHYSYLLRERSDLEIYFLHLVRDPRAVGNSWKRRQREPGFTGTHHRDQRGLFKTTAFYTVSNIAAEGLWRSRPDRYRFLRYEDFVLNPEAALEAIANFVGEDLDFSEVLDGAEFTLKPLHITWGNPNRFDGRSRTIRPDLSWREQRSQRFALAYGLSNVVPARRYGYRIQKGSAMRPPTAALRAASLLTTSQ